MSELNEAEPVTVQLIPKVEEDLRELQRTTGLSRVDLVNRAITLYRFIDDQTRGNGDLLIRDKSSHETHIVKLL